MQVTGTYSPHPRGFGFVDFDTTATFAGPEGTAVELDSGFVPPDLAGGWLDGDRVTATAELDDRGRATITALELRRRVRRFVVGRVATFAGTTFVDVDPRIGSGRLRAVDALASSLQRVDDRQVVVTTGDAEDGTAVAKALVTGPTPTAAPAAIRARAVTIAHGGVSPDVISPGPADVGLPVAESVGNALRALGRMAGGQPGLAAGLDTTGAIPGSDLQAHDRRMEVAVTIDDDSSRDLDDALVAAWDGESASPVQVAVHIADAAAAEWIESPRDRYAATMATTTYLAVGGSAPMLDPALSEDAVSLLPGKDRRVLSVDFEVMPDGTLTSAAVNLGLVRTTARLSYAAVAAHRDSQDSADLLVGAHGPHGSAPRHVDAVASCVTALAEAARRLGAERDARDTLDVLFLPAQLEAAVVDGKIRAVDADPHPRAQQVVERLMVATNELVASWAVEHGVQLLYRTHLGFDPERVDALTTAAEAVEIELPEPPTPASVVRAVATLRADDRDDAADLLATVAAGTVARAATSAEPGGHEGLDAAAYTQFTSPIRRYTDLVVHRQVRAALAGEPAPYDAARLQALAGWLDIRAGAAGHAQALERTSLWSVLLGRNALDWPATAIVTGLSGNGVRIRVPDAGIGGFIQANRVDKESKSLQVRPDGLATVDGELRLGQRIGVKLDRIDPLGRPDFRPV